MPRNKSKSTPHNIAVLDTTHLSQQLSTADKRIAGLELQVKALIFIALGLLSLLGVIYWKLWDIGTNVASLTSKVDGYDKQSVMQLFSSVKTDGDKSPAALEIKQAVEKIVRETVEKNTQGEPVHPGLYYELGMFAATNGKTEPAIEYFQQAVKGNPLDYRSFSSMGSSYITLALNNPDKTNYYAGKALDALRRAVEIKPDHARAHNNLGIAYYLLNQRDGAIEAWNNAIRIDYQFEGPYYNFACMYSIEGDAKNALDYLGKAIVNYGYNNLAELDSDSSLNNIRQTPRFSELRAIVATRTKNAVTP